MPTLIIVETCPAPQCNLSPRDVEQWVQALQEYHALFAPAFHRPEQQDWAGVYLQGLLGEEPRKTIEPIALSLDEKVCDLQHFIGQSRWKTEPVIRTHQRLVGDTLGEADAVMIADESGLPKPGADSVGVARQWCNALGKVANCQGGSIWAMPVAKATPWWTPASICRKSGWTEPMPPSAKSAGCPRR